jgi:hypothetical protein
MVYEMDMFRTFLTASCVFLLILIMKYLTDTASVKFDAHHLASCTKFDYIS